MARARSSLRYLHQITNSCNRTGTAFGNIAYLNPCSTTSRRCLSQSKEVSADQVNQDSTSSTKTGSESASASASASISTDTAASPSFFQRMHVLFEESSGLVELVQLKKAVQASSEKFDAATNHVAACRERVAQAQTAHDQAHKKHVSLLMRREEWGADDAQAFVTITADEVMTRQTLLSAQESLKQAENNSMQCQHAYMDIMRQRYHEEQLWQDKWRLLGTYGTWCLIGLNTMVFIGGQYAMQRREMNRLQHMERLIMSQQTRDMDETLQKDVRETDKATGDKDSGVEGVKENSSDDDTPSKEDRNSVPWKLDDDDEFSVVVYGVPFHTPSLAVGAVISASFVVMVSLFARR